MVNREAVRVVVRLRSGEKLPRTVTCAPRGFVRIRRRGLRKLGTSIVVYGGLVFAQGNGITLTVPYSGTCVFPYNQIVQWGEVRTKNARMRSRAADVCWNCHSRSITSQGRWSRQCGTCGHRWRERERRQTTGIAA